MIQGWGLAHPDAADLVEQRFDSLRATIRPSADPRAARVWTAYVSPAFPAEWPVDQDRNLVHYGYAVSPAPGNTAALWIAAPFARVLVPPEDLPFAPVNDPPTLEPLEDALTDFGIQRVQPLRPEQVDIVRMQDAALIEMRALVEGSLAPDRAEKLVVFQLHWTGVLSTLAAAIRPHHKSWFTWLGQQALARAGLRPPRISVIDEAGREHAIDPAEAHPPSEVVIGSGADARIRIGGPHPELGALVLARNGYWLQPYLGPVVIDGAQQAGTDAVPLAHNMKLAVGGVKLKIRLW